MKLRQQAAGERQVMAVFDKDGKAYAFPVGSIKGGEYKFYSDDMLFIQDPHELYNHWPGESGMRLINIRSSPA